jgi:hypothetical protein
VISACDGNKVPLWSAGAWVIKPGKSGVKPMTDILNLLPCPFCGGVASTEGNTGGEIVVFCDTEGCCLQYYDPATIKKWNKRERPSEISVSNEQGIRTALLKATQCPIEAQIIFEAIKPYLCEPKWESGAQHTAEEAVIDAAIEWQMVWPDKAQQPGRYHDATCALAKAVKAMKLSSTEIRDARDA